MFVLTETMATHFDTVWLDARLATMSGPGLGVIERGAVAARDGRIAFVGAMADLPTGWDATQRVALDGRWVTPGLTTPHPLVSRAIARTNSSCALAAHRTRRSRAPAAESSRP